MSNPWRDLEDLSEQGWSVAVVSWEQEGESRGIELHAQRGALALPPVRAKTVAEATPELLKQIKAVSFAGV